MSNRPLLLPEDVNEIISILDSTPYERFEVRTSRVAVTLARSVHGWTQEWQHVAENAPATQLAEPKETAAHDAVAEEPGVAIVRPPLPGTFYRAPKPGAEPFVEVGDKVGPDTVVGIIETMKVMNSVTAGIFGTVVQVVPADGEMVSPTDVVLRIRTEP